MNFTGKVALITGGTKGIGLATATLFVSLGAKVIVNYGSDKSSADTAVSQLGSENCTAIQADASTLAGVDQMVEAAVCQHSKIDILVLNAAWLPMKTVETMTEADFDRAFSLNVKGPLFLAQKALPHMGDGSRIVFMSSTQCTASTVTAPYTLYNATKGSIEQIVRCMAKDLGARDINVNAVAPGPTGTDLFFQGKSEAMLKQIAGLSAKGRLGKPDEIAAAIVWLCAEGSSWVSGQVLRVNGAMA